MVNRINLLLKAKNITARQFAEEIGIQPSGMSHILSGRNNPSLDFVMKVIKRWPEININWLMFGQGEMFAGLPLGVTPQSAQQPSSQQPFASSADGQPDLFSQPQAAEPVVANNPLASQPEPESQKTQDPFGSSNSFSVKDPVKVQSYSSNSGEITHMAPNPAESNRIDTHNTLPHENRVELPSKDTGLPQQNVVMESKIEEKSIINRKKIVKMIVLYDDHSFTEYFPE